ncbi:uncharacterized protein B0T23DRAFT_299843, partial [Neurospora hispaniola]
YCIYYSCNNSRIPNNSFFFNTDNNLNFSNIPDFLPTLNQIKEQLITQIHIFI